MESIYAVVLLHIANQTIDKNAIKRVLQAANAKINQKQIQSLCKALTGKDLKKILNQIRVKSPIYLQKEDSLSKYSEAPLPMDKKDELKQQKKKKEKTGLSILFGDPEKEDSFSKHSEVPLPTDKKDEHKQQKKNKEKVGLCILFGDF